MKGFKDFIKRLLNVIYVITLILLLSISILVVYVNKPTRQQDLQKSTINCFNGKKYSLQTLEITIYSSEDGKTYTGWGDEEEMKARSTCFEKYIDYNEVIKVGADDQGLMDFIKVNPYIGLINTPSEIKEFQIKLLSDNKNQRNFKQDFYSKTNGHWGISLGWGILTFIIGYIVINLIKETLLYLFLGKKFTFKWLKEIILLLTKKDNE